jgi:hypothetical protein
MSFTNVFSMEKPSQGVFRYDTALNSNMDIIDTELSTHTHTGSSYAKVAFLGLSDTPGSFSGQSGKYVAVKSTEDQVEFVSGGGGVTTFVGLCDTPASYAGQSHAFVTVNSAENALELTRGPEGFGLWNPDAPPISPSAYDDEFSDGVFNGGAIWTVFDINSRMTITENDKGLNLLRPNLATIDITGIYQAIPAGDFSIEAKLGLSAKSADFGFASLALWEVAGSTTGGIYGFSLIYKSTTKGYEIGRYNNYTSFNSAPSSRYDGWWFTSGYFKVRRNGTTYYLDHSNDGVSWVQLWSGTLAFTPTQFGISTLNQNTGQTTELHASFFRYTNSDIGVNGSIGGKRIYF